MGLKKRSFFFDEQFKNKKERNIIIAHQFFTGSGNEVERCDSETITVGGLDNIDVIVGSSESRPNKPAPDGVFYALGCLKSDVQNAVFVGDSDVDILTAKNASLPSIGVLWGFRDREVIEKAGAKYIVSTVSELENTLISLKNGKK